MSIEVFFAGIFECRLATDPDPFDELRGVSGWTFALSGEPDLDRVIRFQPPAVQRWPGPVVGVTVQRIAVDGAGQPGHALVGMPVTLYGDPVFEGLNDAALVQKEPVFPFEIGVGRGDFSCRRSMHDATGAPALVVAAGAGRRPDLLQQAGIADRDQYRASRRQAIADRLATETDAVVKAGLQKRKARLDAPNPRDALMWGPARADLFVRYDYVLERPVGTVSDPAGRLPPIDTVAPWRALFSFGAWDADALVGYVDGKLVLPTVADIV